jgi:tRNA threonylcarbamoyl adenosine modification protein YjeE
MKLSSLKDTQKLAKRISQIAKSGDTIFLYGEIGVGKTTFVRFFINNLEKINKVRKSNILSPTFNIVYDYKIKKTQILHYDLYRLKSYNDILELGMFETAEKYIKIIEWPELIKLKPKNRIEIILKYSKLINSRNIKINSFGKCKNYKLNEL